MLNIWNDNLKLTISWEWFPRKKLTLADVRERLFCLAPPLSVRDIWDTLLIKGQFTSSVPMFVSIWQSPLPRFLNCSCCCCFRNFCPWICGGKVLLLENTLFFLSLNIAGHMWHTFLLCRFLQCTLSLCFCFCFLFPLCSLWFHPERFCRIWRSVYSTPFLVFCFVLQNFQPLH